MPPGPPKRAYLGSKMFLVTPLSKLRLEASTEGILSNKCLLLVEYKQFQKRRIKGITHCILATDNSTIFSQAARIFRASSNLVFTICCAIIPGGALYMWELARLFGVCDFGWEKIFQKY